MSNKEPPSLAQFLSTSDRFRSKFQEQEQADTVSVLKHFGYAPQRFSSRSKPFGRFARRLRSIFTIVGEEAECQDARRREFAQTLLEQLSGRHSMRLVLAGMLADLLHEHTKWTRSSDTANPDPIMCAHSKSVFLMRLHMLFTDGLILTQAAADSFTGEVLKFLSEPQVILFRKRAAIFSLADLADNDELFEPLNRMRGLVRTMTTLANAHTPDSAWQHRFMSFQLPSPLGISTRFNDQSPADLLQLKDNIKDNLVTIFRQARQHPAEDLFSEWRFLLPIAEAHHRSGAPLREAWARAAADFLEKKLGRFAVDLLLCSQHGTGKVERCLRGIPWQEAKGRAHMLNVTLETLLLADQGPKADCVAERRDGPAGGTMFVPTCDFCPDIMRRYVVQFGAKMAHQAAKRRRDAGITREPEPPVRKSMESEASFLRCREAAIASLMSKAPEERRQLATFRGKQIPTVDAAILDSFAPPAGVKKLERAEQLVQQKRKRQEGHKGDASAVALPEPKLAKRRWGAAAQAGEVAESVRAGFALAMCTESRQVAQALGVKRFEVVAVERCSDPRVAVFVEDCARLSSRSAVGHMVVINSWHADAEGPAALACRLVGGFLCDAQSLLSAIKKRKSPAGVQYSTNINQQPRRVYVHPDVPNAAAMTSILQAASGLPGSKLVAAEALETLKKAYKKYVKDRGCRSQPWRQMRAAFPHGHEALDCGKARLKYKNLQCSVADFIDFLSSGVVSEAQCPGEW